MPQFVVSVYRSESNGEDSRGVLPTEELQCRFALTLEEAKHLYPSSVRCILKFVLRSLADLEPNEDTQLDGQSFYLAAKIPLVDVLEAVDTTFADWDGDLGDAEVYIKRGKTVGIPSEEDVMNSDDTRLSFGAGEAVFENYRVWLSNDAERTNRSLAYYYHIHRSKNPVSCAALDSEGSEAKRETKSTRKSKRLSLGERALLTLGLSSTPNDEIHGPAQGSVWEEAVTGTAENENTDDCLTINLISEMYLPDRGITVSLHSLRHLVDVNHWPYTCYVFSLSQGEVTWKITKRYSQFHALHTDLYHQAIQSESERDSDALLLQQLPKIPGKHSLYSRYDSQKVVDKRKQQLIDYLQALVDATRKRPNYILMKFLGMIGGGPGATDAGGSDGNEDTQDQSQYGSGAGSKGSSSTGSSGTSYVHILQLVAEVEIGDIILFQSKSNMSTLQRQATGSKWDHVGVVVRRPRSRRELKRIMFKEHYVRLREELEGRGGEGSRAASERLQRGSEEGGGDESLLMPITTFLDQELCLLEATGDGVTITPLVERLQAYATYEVCHMMAVRKLRPLIPTGFTIDESDDETEEERANENATKNSVEGGLGGDVDGEGKEEDEEEDDQSTHGGRDNLASVRRGTLGLGFLMGAEEKLRILTNFNDFLLRVENSPYGLSVSDLFSRRRAGKEKRKGKEIGKEVNEGVDAAESTSKDGGEEADSEGDDHGWKTYSNDRAVSGESDCGFVVEPPSPRSRRETTRTTVSASDMFPGLEQRTFFCSALAAATLKALGVISSDLNDNFFWPGAFAQGREIDEEAALMNYCFTTEAVISTDIPAISKLVQVNSHQHTKSRLALMNSSIDDDDDDDDDEVEAQRPGSLMKFTLS